MANIEPIRKSRPGTLTLIAQVYEGTGDSASLGSPTAQRQMERKRIQKTVQDSYQFLFILPCMGLASSSLTGTPSPSPPAHCFLSSLP